MLCGFDLESCVVKTNCKTLWSVVRPLAIFEKRGFVTHVFGEDDGFCNYLKFLTKPEPHISVSRNTGRFALGGTT